MTPRKSPESLDPKYQPTRKSVFQAFLLFAFAGAFVDFVTCGVFKIVWLVIYGTVYLGLAATLYNYVLETYWHGFIKPVSIGFLVGAALSHVLFTGWTSLRDHSMNLVSDKPVVLESPEFSDQLYVTSEKVEQRIKGQPKGSAVPISILLVKNYGCIASFKLSKVASEDVMQDNAASWVWKSKNGATALDKKKSGMHEENSRLPWCLIQWF